MDKRMVHGVVLAGGKSCRMGSNKMLLSLGKSTVIGTNIKKLLEIAELVVVVTGRYHHEIKDYLESEFPEAALRVIYNECYESGMFSSVQCGLKECCGDVILVPGDSPFYQMSTLESLMEVQGDFVVPSYQRRGGHPILLRQPVIERLLRATGTSNLKSLRELEEVVWLDVDDEGILLDIDTQEDYVKYTEALWK